MQPRIRCPKCRSYRFETRWPTSRNGHYHCLNCSNRYVYTMRYKGKLVPWKYRSLPEFV